MALGTVAAIGGPAIGNLLGGLFGGGGPSPEDLQKMYYGNLKRVLSMLPQLDTAGLFAGNRADILSGLRQNLASQRGQVRRRLGPEVFSVYEAGLGTGLRNRATQDIMRSRRDVGRLGAEFNLQRVLGAAGAASGATNLMAGGDTRSPLQRGLAGMFQGLGQGVGAYGQSKMDYNQLMRLLQNPEIRALLKLGTG